MHARLLKQRINSLPKRWNPISLPAELRQDMNIKVAAFTVRQRSYNIG